VLTRNKSPKIAKGILFESYLWRQSESIKHVRVVYDLLGVLGDLGGVTEVIMLFFGFFLQPISEHSFLLQAIKKLFLARTNDDDLFLDKNTKLTQKINSKNSVNRSNCNQKLEKEVKMHRVARVKLWDSIQLYASTTFCCFCLKPYSNERKMKVRKLSKMV